MTTATKIFNSEERFPVYCKYPQQYQAQRAFISLDLRTGVIDADYSSEIGNAVPSDVFHNLVIRFPVNAESTADQLTNIIDSNMQTFQSILDKSEIVWDGSNHVGKIDYDLIELTDTGFQCEQEGGIIELANWIENQPYPSNNQTIEQFAEAVLESDGVNGYYFEGEMTIDAILSELCAIWADNLYSGLDIPKDVAQYLIDTGECDNSQWMEELKEFANQ